MIEVMWRLVALIVSIPVVANWIIRRAQKTPYTHLGDYMHRWWLFNPYRRQQDGSQKTRWPFPISIRAHHILREDQDRVLHDHPWNARSIILRGWYAEIREGGTHYSHGAGDTTRLRYGEYHRISKVSPRGVYTLFITGPYRGPWGFLVNGQKVPYRAAPEGREDG